jgi:hypothetical protein
VVVAVPLGSKARRAAPPATHVDLIGPGKVRVVGTDARVVAESPVGGGQPPVAITTSTAVRGNPEAAAALATALDAGGVTVAVR